MTSAHFRNRALKECPLYRNQYGCWSAASVETSVNDVIYMHLECSLDMVNILGAFLDNVGASEALLQLPEHMILNPLLCGLISPMLETRIKGPCLVGNKGAQCLKAVPVEDLLFLVDGPPGRGSVVMGDIQHNIWVILISR